MNENRLTGGLLHILKHARTAWYDDQKRLTAYYEQPSSSSPGQVCINGRRIATLVVDPEGHYADAPSPRVQHMLLEQGVPLFQGWTCLVRTSGMPLEEAKQQSLHHAVRHENGHISAQYKENEIIIFVAGRQVWRVKSADVHRPIAELGLSIDSGWYPVPDDLLALHRRPS